MNKILTKVFRNVFVAALFLCIALSETFSQGNTQVYKTFTDINEGSKVPLQVEILNLSNQSLSKFPEAVLAFTNLKKLLLNNTNIPSVPEGIGVLVNLEVLELNHFETVNNKLNTLPQSIAQLKKLESIGLIGLPNLNWREAMTFLSHLPKLNNVALMKNNFRTLPDGIENIKSLEQVWLGGNPELNPAEVFEKLPFIHQVGFGGSQYTALPTNIKQATNLFNIWLSGNRLSSVVPLAGNSNLRSMALNNNQLKQLPAGTERLNLEALLLDDNPELDWENTFTELATMKSLKRLSLNNNKLNEIPNGLARLSGLQVLSLRGNEFIESDKELIRKLLPSTKVNF
jgi:Leucine-rich repeat (LRR) protein